MTDFSLKVSCKHLEIDAVLGTDHCSMDDRWHQAILSIYQRMHRCAQHGSYEITIGNLDLEILPDVYAPGFFTDTEWFGDVLPGIVGRSSLLEIGTGCGAIALACSQCGANVTTTDINPAAVDNARRNFERYNALIPCFLGDVYAPLPEGVKFDNIFWAHPFNRAHGPVDDMLLRSGFDPRYDGVAKFLDEGQNYLTSGGRILLGTGSSADLAMIFEIAERANLRCEELRRTTLPLDVLGGAALDYIVYAFEPSA